MAKRRRSEMTREQKDKDNRRTADKRLIAITRHSACKYCGSKKRLERHHVSYEPAKVILLCRECHLREHAR
jgi:5-methylcytosine-specific restriction endonuclease McrA